MGLGKALARGRLDDARRLALGLLAPKPLHAASRAMLDVGGRGFTCCFSDFQYALPVKMVIDESTVVPSALVVFVTDLNDNSAANARIHFATSAGTVEPATVLSGTDGLASSVWTPSGTGTVFATASGFGIASQMFDCDGPCEPIDGPRGDSGEGDTFFDPFMAIQSQFNPSGGSHSRSARAGAAGDWTAHVHVLLRRLRSLQPTGSLETERRQTPARLKLHRLEGTWPGTVSLPQGRLRGKPVRR